MRLIDADDFYQRIKYDTDICAEMESDGEMALKKYIDLQPTALELDALVHLIDQGKYLLNMIQLLDYLNTVKQSNQQATKVVGVTLEVDPRNSIPENRIKRYLALRLGEKLFNEGVLEIIKEVIPESGKTKYRCKLKILDD
ncbi:MAG: hypothetical protein MR407_05100 [Roseburia sp.]|nr:hypothetical protein [Roseburia sp.]